MSSTTIAESLRERTRRTVQQELIDAALALFEGGGYEDVTIEQISAAVGISRRSFFRYFGSKDALVLGKFEQQSEAFVSALSSRPMNEHPWISLRRMFDDSVDYLSDPVSGPRARALQTIIASSDALRAGYGERLRHGQSAIVDEVWRRARLNESPIDRIEAAALVASAFGCYAAAHDTALSGGLSLARCLDQAMNSLHHHTTAI